MKKLENYVADGWVEGTGPAAILVDPSNQQPLAEATTNGLDFSAALRHARNVGGPALRAMTFAERGALLRAMSRAIHEHREELIEVGMGNAGNTRGDAKFDIDGASGTLMFYAGLGKELGDIRIRLDGEAVDMGASSRLQGRHLLVPRHGCAVLINAYNFPAWGMAEKAACAILAGMPIVVKPGTITAQLAHRIVEILVAAEIMPAGALTLLCGSAGDLLDHLDFQDVVAFTGSAATGAKIRTHPVVLEKGVRVNIEADSLNSAILGPDVEVESETFDLFVRDVVNDLTQKSGQKCTAIRRVLVPQARLEAVTARLGEELDRIVLGVPREEGVRMGPLAGPGPLADARARLTELMTCTAVVYGDPSRVEAKGDPEGKGSFLAPVVLRAESADAAPRVHDTEVFGPVTTLIPYDGEAVEAARIMRMGQGGLVASFYSDDREFAAALIEAAGPYQGRLVWGSKKIAAQAPSPGTVFPSLIHGGPGRAGAGEELGGARGLDFYSQRVAIQGSGPLLDRVLGAK